MKIHLYGYTRTGGFLSDTSPETVRDDLERFIKLFQNDGYHVVSSGWPLSYDISERKGDRLSLIGILSVE